MSTIKNGGLDQYRAGLFEQQQFGTAGVEGVNFGVQVQFQNVQINCVYQSHRVKGQGRSRSQEQKKIDERTCN